MKLNGSSVSKRRSHNNLVTFSSQLPSCLRASWYLSELKQLSGLQVGALCRDVQAFQQTLPSPCPSLVPILSLMSSLAQSLKKQTFMTVLFLHIHNHFDSNAWRMCRQHTSEEGLIIIKEEEVPAGLHLICCFSAPRVLMIKCPLVVHISHVHLLFTATTYCCNILGTVTVCLIYQQSFHLEKKGA